jgi:hypothetical protein
MLGIFRFGLPLIGNSPAPIPKTPVLAISELRKGLGPSENINLIKKQTHKNSHYYYYKPYHIKDHTKISKGTKFQNMWMHTN